MSALHEHPVAREDRERRERELTQHRANAAELRARDLWADIQNAAQFLGRQRAVKPSMTFILRDDDADLFPHFVVASRARTDAYAAHDVGYWQESANVMVGNVGVCVIRIRPSTEAEEATR